MDMNLKKGLLFLVVFGFFAGMAFACTISSISTSSTASTATVGTDVVVSATLVSDDTTCSASNIRLISTPSLTVNDPPSPGYYTSATISNSGTVKTFTITGGSASTYSYYVQGTTAEGSTSSTTGIIEYVDSTAFTVAGEPSAQSFLTTATTTINITLTNTQVSAVTTSYSISYDSGLVTLSGDSTSGTITVSGGSQRVLQYTVTPVASGTASVRLALGSNSNAFTSTLTISAPDTSSSSTTSGSTRRNTGTDTTTTTPPPASTGTTALDSSNVYPVGGNDMRVSRKAVVSGDSTEFTIAITNQGSSIAMIDLTELIPSTVASESEITFSSGATAAQAGDGTSGLWSLVILPGETKTVSYTIAKALGGSDVSAISSSVAEAVAQAPAGQGIAVSLLAGADVEVGDIVEIVAVDATNNKPLKGVEITITKPSGNSISITTDSNGRASFLADESGGYAYSLGGNYVLSSSVQTVASEKAVPSTPKPPTTNTTTGGTTQPPPGGLPLAAIGGVILLGAVVIGGIAVAAIYLIRKKKGGL